MSPGHAKLRQGALFLIAGGLNTCFGYLAFALFLWLTSSRALAVLLGTGAGILFNFGTYGAVFSRTGFARLPHFMAFYATLVAANVVLLRLFAGFGISLYFGQAIFIIATTPISFLLMRSLIFRDARQASS